ncbi:MAG: transporter substrate-binding domain-containing protein [Synergistaceae bacterium]|nr:transporter substrate-binding domain-containing protein [Synergistaceae bacterium]
MRKFTCAVLAVALMAGACFAQEAVNAGVLTWLGTTEAEFQEGLDDLRKAVSPLMPTEDDPDWFGEDRLEGFILDLVKTRRMIRFYDSLLTMQMALRARQLDEIILPEAVGIYLVRNNPTYDSAFSLNMMPSTIAFGFKGGNVSLQQEFNKAIAAMKKDGTLANLEKTYIAELAGEPQPVKFTEFKGAKTIRAAVTGDLPPIDFIAADGNPAGYNTAILAEIGRRLKKNIRLISVDAGGRSAALASERADVVFWYRNTEGIKAPKKVKVRGAMRDSHEGIILSDPYYEWDVDLVIGVAK